MQVIVKLKDSYPLVNRSRARRQVPAKVLDILSSLGLEMQSMHPDADDAELRSYYTVEVPDQQTASDLIESLAESQALDGAYIKPSDALP